MKSGKRTLIWSLLVCGVGLGRGEARAEGAGCEPAKAAAAAWASIQAGKAAEGCASFLAQVEAAVPDPWAYRGAAWCATDKEQRERWAGPVAKALAAAKVAPELAALGRGYVAHYRNEQEAAEREVRQALH